MSAFVRSLFFVSLLVLSSSLHAAVLRGIVRGGGAPLAGALVTTDSRSALTAADGWFALEVPDGRYMLRVTHDGFRAGSVDITTGSDVVEVNLLPELAEAIVVSGIRAEAKTPVTKTDITRDEIERDYYGQDIPLLLRDAPSIHAYTEAGNGGSGYSYITLRGVSPTRINFTLDGVPLADSEDMATYFADFPDLARSLESIQVQRGVGTSSVGSPSFGGSINLQSVDLTSDEAVRGAISTGSFGSRLASVAYQTGALPGGFLGYARLSVDESDGFRESSGVRQHDLFVSAAKQLGDAQLRLTGFTAHERSQLAFFAADAETLQHDLRANPLSADDKDSFGYDLGQLQYLRSLGPNAGMTASAYYQRGYGWYDLTDTDALHRYGLDGMLLGSMLTMSVRRGAMTASYGVHVNSFKREHTRDVVDGARDYFNYGRKNEANAFAKLSVDRGRTHLYGDAQLRYTDFRYHGDVDIPAISWTFFNPKVGARYDLTPASSIYSSVGLSTREPARNDLFQGEDNASFAHDLHAVKPERLLDVETGYEWRGAASLLKANVYAMEFRNEIASTGELSDIGLLLRRNVDRSYRRGVELEASWQASPLVRLRGNANVSRNRIADWTQFYDVYDESGTYIDSEPLLHRHVNPVLTPAAIATLAFDVTPTRRLAASVVGRYVAKSYLDNTNDPAFVTPSFVTVDGNVAWSFSDALRLSVQVNNLTNNRRVYGSGYSYLYSTRAADGSETAGGVPYYFPQATRNAIVTLDFRL